MALKLSTLFLRTLREDPADAEVASHKLLIRAGYIRRAAPGIYSWLPLGLRVRAKIEAVVREEMAAAGSQEVHFPALLPREPYEASGRWSEYGPNLFRLKDRRENDYLLAPTHEEMFTLLVKDMYSSYKDLPVTLYQLQTKYRDEARPRAGLIRGREFVMKDAYSFDIEDEGLDVSYQAQRDAYERIFTRLGLDYVIVSATSGAMGGSHSEEFLSPSPIGEDTFARSAGGYAANVEAVTTVAPDPIDASDAPAARTVHTPGATTIEALLEALNASEARESGSWEASDTLKHVAFVAEQPSGRRDVVVIAIPGDREIDAKRLEAALSPALVEPAGEKDLKRFPQLVPGFIGPQTDVWDEESDDAPQLRYYVDPRVVAGTSWVTGANEADSHVIGLVAGRDFELPATIEAAEVREGDPAPDGSGPLELARGIEIGHIFQLGRKYAEALDLKVLNQQGKATVVTMGSYGLGITRALAALAENNHDDLGLAWPIHVAPAHVHVVATGKDPAVFEAAEALVSDLEAQGIEVLYDDRVKVSPGVKFADAELLGVPWIVVVGRGLADGVVELRARRPQDGESARQVRVETAGDEIGELLRSQLANL